MKEQWNNFIVIHDGVSEDPEYHLYKQAIKLMCADLKAKGFIGKDVRLLIHYKVDREVTNNAKN
jgi:hypothetical protein